MSNHKHLFAFVLFAGGCAGDATPETTGSASGLSTAFDAFRDNVVTYKDGDEVVIETTGLPDHTSVYWSPSHELHIDESDVDIAPGYIDDFNGSYTLRVPFAPEKASSTTSTGLGPIGIAVSGAVIYNDEEGPNVPIDNAIGSLDYTGAHTGPQSYHYHLEPVAWTEDDDALIGIIGDGFLLFGRKCASTGDHPSDLDASGGHTSTTQYDSVETYHYHVPNEVYLGQYYILFSGDYQGTPSQVQ
ncbi:MAG: YHYH protein [Alphaproteobacteria bacterium]|nr:YHYH protein [Alphaproteobacteria bacterium]